MQKTKPDLRVVPFTGYLHPSESPSETSPPQNKIAAPSIITFAVLLFVGGLALGAISVHQSAEYSQMEALKAQSKQLSEVKKTLCGY